MCEAFAALRFGLASFEKAEESQDDSAGRNWLYVEAGMQCRYAFLLAANALESAANALLLGLKTSVPLYEDLERLPTLLKFEVVCMAYGKKLDRGSNLYANIKDVVKCRNEFVHPKPREAAGILTNNGKDVEINVTRTRARNYPIYFGIFEPKHARQAIGDILAFLSWVVFDICRFPIMKGTMLLGRDSYGSTGDVIILAHKYGFDTRTFGESKHKRRTIAFTIRSKRRGHNVR